MTIVVYRAGSHELTHRADKNDQADIEQRKGQFAMGVSLESGLAIDALAAELTEFLNLVMRLCSLEIPMP